MNMMSKVRSAQEKLDAMPPIACSFNIHSYDEVAISSSAGKDSQAMTEYVMAYLSSHEYQGRVVMIHADLGRVEWKGTKELCQLHADHYGIELEIVSRPAGKKEKEIGLSSGDLLDQVEARGMWPSSAARYCTSDQKRNQIRKVYTALSRTYKDSATKEKPLRILECIGLRAEESSGRAKKAVFENNKSASSGKRTVDTWLPIHHWTEEDVWDHIWLSGVPYHYAYELGMPRLSCAFCIFSPREGLKIAGRHNPELLKEYVRIEEKIGHTFKAPPKNIEGKKDTWSLGAILRELQIEKETGNVSQGKMETWTM